MTNNPIPTVKIANAKAPRGWTIINEADFDPGAHRLYDALTEAEKATLGAPRPAEPHGGPAVITHEVARNGRWRIYRDGAEIEKGKGAAALEARLRAFGA